MSKHNYINSSCYTLFPESLQIKRNIIIMAVCQKYFFPCKFYLTFSWKR